ncbi:hypothetical protein BH23ACT9_BH23ACT9_28100 [soil metagenome]
MELLLRLDGCGGPQSTRDVAVSVDGAHTVAQLAAALAPVAHRPAPLRLHRVATGEVLEDAEELQQVGLCSGERLRLVGPSAHSTPLPGRHGIELSVVSGADAGRTQLLAPGTYVLGRSPSADILVADAQVSQRHIQVHITEDHRAWVTAGDTTNPTLVNGIVMSAGQATPISAEDVIQIGATTIGLRPAVTTPPVERDRLGHVPFHRTPHQPVAIPAESFAQLGNVPSPPEQRGFSPLRIIAPVLAGIMLRPVAPVPAARQRR